MSAASLLLFAFAAACGPIQEDPTVTPGADETATAAAGTASPDATASATPEASASPTPIPGLTDTGFIALDGRPLYAECIQAGAPMPPEYPEPVGTAEPLPTYDPSVDPNEGRTPPDPSELPPFDPRTVAPADTTGWTVYDSKCYGYEIAVPPDWTGLPFRNAGYQQGESGEIRSSSGNIKIDSYFFYTPVSYDPSNTSVSLGQGFYLLSREAPVFKDGATGSERYLRVKGEFDGVQLVYSYAVRPSWYFNAVVLIRQPYDEQEAGEARAILESVKFK